MAYKSIHAGSTIDNAVSRAKDDNTFLTRAEKGLSVASLVGGKVPSEQLPSYISSVENGYYYNGVFYADESRTQTISPNEGTVYVDLTTNDSYRWSGNSYILLANDSVNQAIRWDIDQSNIISAEGKERARNNIGIKYSNPNLLDNPFFTINQRGLTTYTSNTSTYTFDRWFMVENSNAGGVKLEKTNDGVLFTKITPANSSAGRIAQKFETSVWDNLRGKQITFSITYKSTVTFLLGYGTSYGGVYSTNISCSPSADWITVSATRTVGTSSDDYWFSLAIANAQPAGTVEIKAIKVEEGSVSTIANDSAPDYATELMKCMQYLYVIRATANYNAIVNSFAWGATNKRVVLPVPKIFGENPRTLTVSTLGSFDVWCAIAPNVYPVTAMSKVNNGTSDAVFLNVTTESTAIVTGTPFTLRSAEPTSESNPAVIILSKEI